jgi:CheY-like chemotaxis protein
MAIFARIGAPGAERRILVADDHDEVREALRDILQDEGSSVVAARNGAEALDRLLAGSFDAAVLDVRMPGLTGFGVIEQLRGRGRSCPVVLVSVSADEPSRRLASRLGAFGPHQKPIAVDSLLRDVAAAIEAAQPASPVP